MPDATDTLRAALERLDEAEQRRNPNLIGEAQRGVIAAARAALQGDADAPTKPPVPWSTIRQDATERGLFSVVDEAMIGRKLTPSRRRLIVGNIVMAVSRWRETFRDCGCWKTADGYALCTWHETMLGSQVAPLRDALAATGDTDAPVGGLSAASEKLIRDWDQYPDAIDASELSARLWLIEREAVHRAAATSSADAGAGGLARERKLYVLTELVRRAHDEMPERLNNRTRVNVNTAWRYADPYGGYSSGETRELEAQFDAARLKAADEGGGRG